MNLAELIKKLEREQFETSDPKHSVEALAYRKGHNDAKKAVLVDLQAMRLADGLVELVENAPVDTRHQGCDVQV